MSLEQTLKTALRRLRSGHLDNEAQVKQAVILPVLRALGWDDTDPEAFKPEYSAGHGLVDYALLDRGRPQLFIEAKRIGAIDVGGEEQLFRYASNKGVPLLVLTDGDRWDCYLSMADGVPGERRFYRLELQHEGKITEYVKFLEKHLRKDRVVSGDARLSAEKLLKSNRARERARKAIPNAWQALLEAPDEMLRDLLAEKVAIECETTPELDDVEAFLRNHSRAHLATPPEPPEPIQPKTPVNPPIEPPTRKSKIVGFILKGNRVEPGTAIGTLAKILTTFDREDLQFMEHLAARTASKNRNLVARNYADLYKKPHLSKYSKDLGNGWWLGTNLSTTKIKGHIETACRVAGIGFGTQLELVERQSATGTARK